MAALREARAHYQSDEAPSDPEPPPEPAEPTPREGALGALPPRAPEVALTAPQPAVLMDERLSEPDSGSSLRFRDRVKHHRGPAPPPNPPTPVRLPPPPRGGGIGGVGTRFQAELTGWGERLHSSQLEVSSDLHP